MVFKIVKVLACVFTLLLVWLPFLLVWLPFLLVWLHHFFCVATVPLETKKHWFKIEGTSMCGYPSTSHFLETIKHWFKMKVPACVVTLSRVMGTSLDNGPP